MLRKIRAIALLLTACLHAAVVIDRMAVIVGKHTIKTSDIDRDLRLTAFLNSQKPEFSADAKHQAAERLIEQTIIRDEIANGGYRRPSDSDAAALLKQIAHDRFGGSDARLREALLQYGVTEDQLRAQLLWQLTVLRFIDQRFRNGVLVTDEEVRAYYDQHPQTGSFEAIEPRIRASLEGTRINENFAAWIDQARKRNRIEYRQGALE